MYIYTELSYFLFTIALVTPHKLNIILEALLVTNNVFRWSKLSTIMFLVVWPKWVYKKENHIG